MTVDQSRSLQPGDTVRIKHIRHRTFRVKRVHEPQSFSAGTFTIIEVCSEHDPDQVYRYTNFYVLPDTEEAE